MKSRWYYFLTLIFFTSNYTFAQCGDISYINTMSELVEKKKEEIGGYALDFPTSLVVAQAILESGYGKSYSARVRNNHFGIISKNGFAVFSSIEHGIERYFSTLLERPYYTSLQKKLQKGEKDPFVLLKSFASIYAADKRYSQKVSTIIHSCKLTKLDT